MAEFLANQFWTISVPNADGTSRTVCGQDSKTGEEALIFFTDEDLANRHIAKAGPADAIARQIVEPGKLLKFLAMYQSKGVRWVEYDPGEGKRQVTFPISQVIHELRTQTGTD